MAVTPPKGTAALPERGRDRGRAPGGGHGHNADYGRDPLWAGPFGEVTAPMRILAVTRFWGSKKSGNMYACISCLSCMYVSMHVMYVMYVSTVSMSVTYVGM